MAFQCLLMDILGGLRPHYERSGQSRIILRDGTVVAKPKNDIGNEILYADLPVPAGR